MGTLTTIREFYKPDVGETGWGLLVNAIFDEIDGDIDFEGKVKIWPSGGISIANTSGIHTDPGDDVLRIFQGTQFEWNVEIFGGAYLYSFVIIPKYTSDVSNPPTEAEIEALAGLPDFGNTFIIEDDTDGFVWLVSSGANAYWYIGLTEAI